MNKLVLIVFTLLVALHTQLAVAENNEYSKMREGLKRKKPLENSFITDPALNIEKQPVSLNQVLDEAESECNLHRNSAKCLEFRRMGRSRHLAEKKACKKDPLGKRCSNFHDYAFKKMLRRQSACRGGLESRRCSIVRAGTRSSGQLK